MTLREFRFGSVLGAGQILSWGARIEKKDPREPNILKFAALRSDSYVLNDEVKYYDQANAQVFGGYIQKITEDTGVQGFEVADYSVELAQRRFSAVYAAGTLLEDVLQDVIDTYSTLTYTGMLSTSITLSKPLVFRDEWVMDAVIKILELFNGSYSVNFSKEFTPSIKASVVSSQSFEYGVDQLAEQWSTDIIPKAEKVIVLGAIIDQRTTETLSGTAQTIFYTTFKPENIEIDGFTQTTENIDGDYVVDIENKKITFDSAQTNPVVSYTYKSQVRVELGTGKTIVLEKKYITSKVEARKLAQAYKTRFEDGAQTSKWLKVSTDIDAFNVGDSIYITDDSNNKTGYYDIREVTFEMPNRITVSVGEDEDSLFDFNKETIERIKQLEKSSTNSEYITNYGFLNSTITITITTEIVELYSVSDTGTVLFASDTTLASDGDLISDTGIDAYYALAYDDGYVPTPEFVDYLTWTTPWDTWG